MVDEWADLEGGAAERTSRVNREPSRASEEATPTIESKYWMWHFYLTLWWVMWIPAGFLMGAGDSLGAMGLIIAVPGYLIMLLVIPAAFGSLIGYHVEAKRLKKADSDWVPSKWLYTAGHVLLSPLFIAPIYLLQRHRHIGIPWSDLRIWS